MAEDWTTRSAEFATRAAKSLGLSYWNLKLAAATLWCGRGGRGRHCSRLWHQSLTGQVSGLKPKGMKVRRCALLRKPSDVPGIR
jgi:hypothetical protein